MPHANGGVLLRNVRVHLAAIGIGVVVSVAPSPSFAQEASAPEEVRFPVYEYVVRGNTVLAGADVERTLAPFMGPARTVADVQAAQQALQKVYQDAGYVSVSVDVPPQDARDGVIEFRINEGRVGRVRVEGADYVLPSLVRSSMESLEPGEVPHLPTLQADLRKANSRPSHTIEPRFRAGLAPGTVDVDLVVEDDRPWGAGVELNDRFNRSTERLRLNFSANYDNLWQRGHSANIFYQTAPEEFDQIQVVSASYFAPLGYSRTSLLGYVVASNTDVATAGGLTVIGEGFNFGARLIHTLDSDAQGTVHSIIAGVDYKDFTDEIGLTLDDGEEITFQTPVNYLPFTFQYRMLRGRPRATQEFTLGTTFGFDGIVGQQREFGGVPDDPLTVVDENELAPGRRAGAEASFIYLFGSYKQERQLPADLAITGAVDFQYAPEPLIANEQFSMGGLTSVRGYREAEALSDTGVRGSLELSRNMEDVLPESWRSALDWRLFGFGEGAIGEIVEPLPEEEDDFVFGSVGLGTEITLFDTAVMRLNGAYRFTDDPSGSGDEPPTDIGDVRLHFSIAVNY